MTLNTNGTSKGNPGLAGIGGIIGVEESFVIGGYFDYIGETTIWWLSSKQ